MLSFWDKVPSLKKITWLPAPLIAVVGATLANELFLRAAPQLALQPEHLVKLPATDGPAGLIGALHLPDWSAVTRCREPSTKTFTAGSSMMPLLMPLI